MLNETIALSLKAVIRKSIISCQANYMKNSSVCGRGSLDMPRAFFKSEVLLMYLSTSAFPTRKLLEFLNDQNANKENIS